MLCNLLFMLLAGLPNWRVSALVGANGSQGLARQMAADGRLNRHKASEDLGIGGQVVDTSLLTEIHDVGGNWCGVLKLVGGRWVQDGWHLDRRLLKGRWLWNLFLKGVILWLIRERCVVWRKCGRKLLEWPERISAIRAGLGAVGDQPAGDTANMKAVTAGEDGLTSRGSCGFLADRAIHVGAALGLEASRLQFSVRIRTGAGGSIRKSSDGGKGPQIVFRGTPSTLRIIRFRGRVGMKFTKQFMRFRLKRAGGRDGMEARPPSPQ